MFNRSHQSRGATLPRLGFAHAMPRMDANRADFVFDSRRQWEHAHAHLWRDRDDFTFHASHDHKSHYGYVRLASLATVGAEVREPKARWGASGGRCRGALLCRRIVSLGRGVASHGNAWVDG